MLLCRLMREHPRVAFLWMLQQLVIYLPDLVVDGGKSATCVYVSSNYIFSRVDILWVQLVRSFICCALVDSDAFWIILCYNFRKFRAPFISRHSASSNRISSSYPHNLYDYNYSGPNRIHHEVSMPCLTILPLRISSATLHNTFSSPGTHDFSSPRSTFVDIGVNHRSNKQSFSSNHKNGYGCGSSTNIHTQSPLSTFSCPPSSSTAVSGMRSSASFCYTQRDQQPPLLRQGSETLATAAHTAPHGGSLFAATGVGVHSGKSGCFGQNITDDVYSERVELMRPTSLFIVSWAILPISACDKPKEAKKKIKGICNYRNPVGLMSLCPKIGKRIGVSGENYVHLKEVFGVYVTLQTTDAPNMCWLEGLYEFTPFVCLRRRIACISTKIVSALEQ